MTQDEYDRDLEERQKRHLQCVRGSGSQPAEACLHHSCQECLGTGVKHDGSMCVHFISCSCFRCSPRC